MMMTLLANAAAPPDLLHSGALGYMIDGGPFMWPILFMAILAAGVVIERFRSLRMIITDSAALRSKVLQLVHDGKIERAIDLCAESRGPTAAILGVGLRRYYALHRLHYEAGRTPGFGVGVEEQVVKAMDDYKAHIAAALERHLPVLATVANVAPMVGSVGTVVGMVVLFADVVEKFGKENIILTAAAGIKIKLIVTAFGLLVGIPAYIFHNYFTTIVGRFILEADETASQLIEALTVLAAAEAAGAELVKRPSASLEGAH